jgi:divalent metal cation (Fe/Co/Zn/Cd) transporter
MSIELVVGLFLGIAFLLGLAISRRPKAERVGRLLVSLAMSLVAGFAFMIAVGLVREHWLPTCPGIGYWWAVLIAFFLRSSLYLNDAFGKDSDARRRRGPVK